MLKDFETTKDEVLEANSKATKATKEKLLATHRKNVEEQLLSAARDHHITAGKWMLFPRPQDVDTVWATVAKAVASDQLGMSAKVAPDSEGKGKEGKRARLICIYTEDFSDKEEIKKVLGRLNALGLVPRRGSGGIAYKPGEPSFLSSLGFLLLFFWMLTCFSPLSMYLNC